MAEAFELAGDPAAQLRKLSRDLRLAGEVTIKRELTKSIRLAAVPLIDAAKASAASELPKGGGRGVRSQNRKTGAKQSKLKKSGFASRGGTTSRVESLASRVANAKYTVKVLTGANPGVVLQATGSSGRKINLQALDDGTVRHPLFGNKSHWYPESVKVGWWSEPMQAGLPVVEVAVKAAIATAVETFYTGMF